MQARSHRIADDRDGGNAQRNAQNTQKKRLYFMSVKLPEETRITTVIRVRNTVKQTVKASVNVFLDPSDP